MHGKQSANILKAIFAVVPKRLPNGNSEILKNINQMIKNQ